MNSQCEQLLAITADNASPNDVMVDRLEDLIPSFGGAANRVRCFDHVTNLVAKSLLASFDGGKAIEVEGEGDNDENEVADDEGEMDDIEGWTDERTRMSEEERLAHDERVEPVATVLVKVSEKRYQGRTNGPMSSHQLRKIASSTLRSTTKRLPHWFDILKKLKLNKKTLPRDVRT